MTRITQLDDDFIFNFDDNHLYQNGKPIVELDERLSEVLAYLADSPNCKRTAFDICNGLEGQIQETTVRGYILRLRRTHNVFERVIISNKKGSGYKYTGGKTESIDPTKNNIIKTEDIEYTEFLRRAKEYEKEYIQAILFCPCKWGACCFDETHQNTNTCEGAIVLLSTKQSNKYLDEIEEAIDFLKNEITETGLKSRSLDGTTIVPTSMFLYLHSLYNGFDYDINELAKRLWNARSKTGWGIYVKQMDKYANIGCTYWALMGLKEHAQESSDQFQKYLRTLFKYDGAFSYGNTINDVNPRFPCLYATSMMYIIYSFMTKDSQEIVGNKYDPEKALNFIVKNFDTPFYLTEQEGINGVEVEGKISVHTVNWTHISIDYSLKALSIALKNGKLSTKTAKSILSRVLRIIDENSEKSGGRLYWSPPNLTIEQGNRGKMIFPTMHFVMGLQSIMEAIEKLICNDLCQYQY